jgi:hypothetical protein
MDTLLDLSPLEITKELAIRNITEQAEELANRIKRLPQASKDIPRLKYQLVSTIKSLAYLLQDLLVTTKADRQAGAIDSVTATLGEVTAQITGDFNVSNGTD